MVFCYSLEGFMSSGYSNLMKFVYFFFVSIFRETRFISKNFEGVIYKWGFRAIYM